MRTVEYTIDNENGELERETLYIIRDEKNRGLEKMEIIHIVDRKTREKVENITMHFIPTFFYNKDKDFKRLYLN